MEDYSIEELRRKLEEAQRAQEKAQRAQEEERRLREEEQRLREEEQQRRHEAEARAADAESITQNTTVIGYLKACHGLSRALKVVTDRTLTTQGDTTNPTGRLFPRRILLWRDFLVSLSCIYLGE